MRAIRDRLSEILCCIIICVLWFLYREQVTKALDGVFLGLFGKTLTGRGMPLQVLVFGFLFLFSLCLPFLLERLSARSAGFREAANWLIPLLFICPASQVARIVFNQVPHRDDFWEIAEALQYGFPGTILYDIRTYNGRYFSWGLKSLYALFDPAHYWLVLLTFNILLLAAAASLLAGSVLTLRSEDEKSRGELRLMAVMMGCTWTAAAVLMASNEWDVWLWASGAFVYGVGISLCMMSTALILRIAADPSRRGWRLVVPAVLCFCTCGCTELCTASLAAFLLIILVWKRVETGQWDKRVLFFLAEVFLCCVGIFLLSGSLQSASDRAHLNTSRSFGAWLSGVISWAFNGLWGFTLIKCKLLLLFSAVFICIGTQLRFDKGARCRLLIIAGLLFLMAHGVLMINTALDYMPPRVITIGICWLFSAIALICLMLGSMIPHRLRYYVSKPLMAVLALVVCLRFSSFYYQNIDRLMEIRGSWIIRDAVLAQYRGGGEPVKTCSLPSIGTAGVDLYKDESDPFNIGTAKYYQVPSITADHRCPPFGPSFLGEYEPESEEK